MSHDIPAELQKLVGEVIAGRYRVERCIGFGGMAVVFLGRHEALDRTVAIKALRPEFERVPAVLDRFNREARIASHLEHPNCVQVFDFGATVSGITFMVMPYLDGAELSTMVSIPFPPSQAVALGLQILAGLSYLHKCGVVHRDLKPENVFITRDHQGRSVLRIVDFGVSRLLQRGQWSDTVHTKVGTIVGTPSHMSPEQAMGLETDPRADLYALGIIMYQMLTGRPPFWDRAPERILHMQVRDPPPPLPSDTPDELAWAVSRLLAKLPEERFEDAASTMRVFRTIGEGLATDPTPWRPVLPTRESGLPNPSAPPLGAHTFVASDDTTGDTTGASNRPPSERSGHRAVPTSEGWSESPLGASGSSLQEFGAALDQVLSAEESHGDMLIELFDGIEELDTGDCLNAPIVDADVESKP